MNSASMQVNCPALSQPDTASENSASAANSANFKEHQLQLTQATKRLEKTLQEGSCTICFNGFAEADADIQQLSLLPCFHMFHEACVSEAIKYQPACPDCRTKIDRDKIKTYASNAALKAALPRECTQPLCTAAGSQTELEAAQLIPCPYPLDTFPHQQAEQFLEKNSSAILDWLKRSFEQKSYTCEKLEYCEAFGSDSFYSYLSNTPVIRLKVNSHSTGVTRSIFYPALEINDAKSPEGAFKNLLEDLRTDLLILNLRGNYPAFFRRDTALFIYHYDIHSNRIFINGEDQSIPLRSVFNPSTKSFSWDNLKHELEKIGFNYSDLFDSTPDYSEEESDDDSVSIDGIEHRPQRPASENQTVEVLSGELETDAFLF